MIGVLATIACLFILTPTAVRQHRRKAEDKSTTTTTTTTTTATTTTTTTTINNNNDDNNNYNIDRRIYLNLSKSVQNAAGLKP